MDSFTLKQARKLSEELEILDNRIEVEKKNKNKVSSNINPDRTVKVYLEYYRQAAWGRSYLETMITNLTPQVILDDFDCRIDNLKKDREEVLKEIDNLNC